MAIIKDKTIEELNDEFEEFINNSILSKDFNGYSADRLKKVSAKDWFDKRSKYLKHKLLFGSQDDYVNKNTFLLMGLAILSSKIMNQLNSSTEPKKIGLLESYLDELKESDSQELNHSQLEKSNLFHLDFKKHVGKDIDWDSPSVDYVRLRDDLENRLSDYIDTLNDIRYKDFGTVKVRASEIKSTSKVVSPYYTIKEAATVCKISTSKIYKDLKSGKLVHDVGDQSQGYKFLKETLDDYVGKT